MSYTLMLIIAAYLLTTYIVGYYTFLCDFGRLVAWNWDRQTGTFHFNIRSTLRFLFSPITVILMGAWFAISYILLG